MDLHLQGKRALVTGSTAGIGHAIARRLTGEGAAVIVNGRAERFAQKPAPDIPEQYAAFIRAENVRWAKVVRDARITID